MSESVGISLRMAEHAAARQYAGLPREAILAAQYSLLDALGVSLAASTLEEGCHAFRDLALASGIGSSLVLGTRLTASASLAALANGALAHALDFEDVYDGTPVHASAAAVPAALALAQQLPAVSGKDLITALALATDLSCRLGLALRQSPEVSGWYPPPLLGTQGATTACAKLQGLAPSGFLDAWSLAIGQGGCTTGFKNAPRSTVRAVRDSYAAQVGLQAACLAASGTRGYPAPFEGPAGFYAVYAGGAFDGSRLVRDLGSVYEGTNVSYKAYPSCRGTHPYIDAALALRAQGLVDDAIAEVRLSGNKLMRMLAEPTQQKRAPASAIDAKFSAPFCFASALVHGTVDLGSFTAPALAEPRVLRLASRVLYDVDPGQPADALATGTTTVVLHDGQSRTVYIEAPHGSPASPLSESALVTKFRHCVSFMRPRPSEEDVTFLLDLLLHIDHEPDLQVRFFPALARMAPL